MSSFACHTEELRVPVQRARVQIHTAHDCRTVSIFLARTGSPEEVLEDDAPFFPAEEGAVVRLYARSSVIRLVVDDTAPLPDSPAFLGLTYQTRLVAVYLHGGQVVRGALMTLSTGMRTLDLLNEHGRSFAVHADGKVHHIAKAHVEHVEELA